MAKHRFPNQVNIISPNTLEVSLRVNKVIEAQDMLDAFNPILRTLAKTLMRIKPGYFRILSDFQLKVNKVRDSKQETGTALHEIVIFKPIREDKV